MLNLERISKSYPQRGPVLENLDFNVEKGDSIAITGPSGCGKTSLLNIIGTLDRPDSGDLFFNGLSLLNLNQDDLARHRNRNIGFVFQESLLLKHLTIKENIMLPLFTTKISETELAETEIYLAGLMKRMGINDLISKYPFQISGGEAQRVSIVRSLIRKPSLLLADEPTGSLDINNADIIGSLLSELNNDMDITMIVVTHSNDIASRMKKHFKLINGKLCS